MSTSDTQAERRRESHFRLSPVWIVPLIAALIGCWLLYQNVLSRGPTVMLEARNAESLEAGKTPIKVRSVEVGQVEAVRLTDDYSGAVVEVRMNPGTEGLLAEDSRFWVVKPRVGRRGISGLNTILSGAYVQLRPGDAEKAAYRFDMLDQPPVSQGDVPGVSVTLYGRGESSLNIGDPIVYQGQMVGRIETAEYEPDAMQMRYGAFVERPYDDLVTENTQFWNRSGIDFRLTSEGVDVNMGSLEALVSGGLAFGVPEDVPAGEAVENGANFELYASRDAARQDRYDRQIEYVVLFPDSVRGLNEGAPVEFNGIRVGTVASVPYFRDAFNLDQFEDFRIPVLITFEPQRLGPAWSDRSLPEWRERLRELFENGLRASVRTGNLFTGALFVDLQFAEGAGGYDLVNVGDYPVFPSQSGGIAGLEQKLTQLLDKLNSLELARTTRALNDTLSSSNDTFRQMEQTLASLNEVLGSDGARELPGELRATLKEMRRTLETFRQGEPTHDNFNRTLERMNGLLEELTPLARTLRQEPDALLFGREPEDDPMPRAKP